MLQKIGITAMVLFLASGMYSCKKGEGEGGTSIITGKVKVRDYNASFTVLNDTYYGPEFDVYIVYGENTVYDNDMKTHYDGTFEFKYLRKGNYTIYAYSKDSTLTNPAGIYPVMHTVEITENGQTVDIGDLTVLD